MENTTEITRTPRIWEVCTEVIKKGHENALQELQLVEAKLGECNRDNILMTLYGYQEAGTLDKGFGFPIQEYNPEMQTKLSNFNNLLTKKDSIEKNLKQYLDIFVPEAVEFTAELQSKGIYPLVVIPRTMFMKIFEESPSIYLFEHLDEEGNTSSIAKPEEGEFSWSIMTSSLPLEDIIRKIFPERKDRKEHSLYLKEAPPDWYGDYMRIKVSFTAAPLAFFEQVRKLKSLSYHPCIGAHYSAFTITQVPLDDGIDECPFVYCYNKDKSVVAICGFFGNYPAEEEMIEKMKKWGLDVCLN